MNQHSNPIEFLIDFAWANGADRFVVNNAKDELKRLRKSSTESKYTGSTERDPLRGTIGFIEDPVAYAKTTDDGWLYDLNIRNNPYDDQSKVVPLYRINHG